MRCSAAAAAAMLVFASNAAVACQCAPLNLATRISHADLVLVGRVVSFKPLQEVTLQPAEVFKGSVSGTLTVEAGQSDCDFFLPPVSPKTGEEYLLYLRQTEGLIIANRCLGSGAVSARKKELEALRQRFQGTKP